MTEPHTDEQRIAELEAEVERLRTCEKCGLTGGPKASGFRCDECWCELEAENAQLKLRNRGTLANNLCPDHRDKQQGKPCLACEVERLRKANSNHLRSLVKIADDYERLAFPEDDPTVRRTREKILKDVRKIVELAR